MYEGCHLPLVGQWARRSWLCLGALVVLALLPYQRAQRGVIRGVVRDPDGDVLPGVRVVATTPPGEPVRRPRVSVFTAEDGTYALHPRPGIFEVRAELDGFCGGVQPRVQVGEGEARTVDLTLRPNPIEFVLWVRYPLPGGLAHAGAVVHMRIARSHEPRLWVPDISCGGGNVFTEHELAVITPIKTEHPQWPEAERVLFVQRRAGVYSDGQTTVHGPETPYAIGEEYVAFLYWSPEEQRWESLGAPNAMIPVHDGRIVWRGAAEEGVYDGMPVEAFLERLRELRR